MTEEENERRDHRQDLEHDGAQPTPALSTTLPDAPTGRTIVVNGREHRFDGDEIGRGDLARLAFPDIGTAEGGALTIAYDHGPSEAPSGLIVPGRAAKVLHGQTFSVSHTDRS